MAKLRLCPYCGHEMRAGTRRAPTADHVVPRSRGGALDSGNKLVVCGVCNSDKGSLTLADWHALLALRGDPRTQHVAVVLQAHGELSAAWPHGGGDLASAIDAL